jgi:anti-sigma factor ChrR (cupin superfamily)
MMKAESSPPSRTIAVADLEWRLGRFGLWTKDVWSDPPTQRKVVLTRFWSNGQLPMHRHVGDELLYVIEGAISDEASTIYAGNVGYRPPGCVHTGDSRNGATVLGIFTGGLEAADQIGNSPQTQVFQLSEIPWTEAMPGLRMKRVWQDKATGRFAALTRFEPGAKIARHRHTGDELIFVIEGSTEDDYGEVTAGNLNFRPPGCTHTVTSRNGATIFNIVRGGAEPA